MFCKRDILRHHHAKEGIVHISVASTSASLLKRIASVSKRSPKLRGRAAFFAKLWHSRPSVSAISDDRVPAPGSPNSQEDRKRRLSVHLYENCIHSGLDLRYNLVRTEFTFCDSINSVAQVCLPKYSHIDAAFKPRSNPSHNGKARF